MAKRIAMISYHTCPLALQEGKQTGGMEIYVLELSKQLVKNGVCVDIFTRSQDPSNQEIIDIAPNLRLIHVKAGPQSSVQKEKLSEFIPEFVENVLKYKGSINIDYDLIHAHYYLSGLVAKLLNQKLEKNLPVVSTFHTLNLMKNLVARNTSEYGSEFRTQTETEIVKYSDIIVAMSESEKNYLEYLYEANPDKVKVIPPGVNREHFRPMDKKIAKQYVDACNDSKLILYVGRIEPLKGIDAIIYALKILKVKCPEQKVCLLIVGGDVSQDISEWPEEMQKLEQLRSTLNISSSVKFIGQKKQEELPLYYNAADVVVMPSHYESFGMVALEAMSCGTPVITTNVTGISSIIDKDHSSLITYVNNPLVLAEKISDLLFDDDHHAEISTSLRKSSEDLAWDKVAAKITNIYKSLLDK